MVAKIIDHNHYTTNIYRNWKFIKYYLH